MHSRFARVVPRHPRYLFSLFLLVVPAAVCAAGAPLSLPEAQRIAAERSRQLVAQESAVLASREMASRTSNAGSGAWRRSRRSLRWQRTSASIS